MFFRHVILKVAPQPNSLVVMGAGFLSGGLLYRMYRRWYICTEKMLRDWHYKELCRMDSRFQLEQHQKELVRARNEARDRGIGPMDPGYPDIFDFVDPNLLKLSSEVKRPFW